MIPGLASWNIIPAGALFVTSTYHTMVSRGIGYLTSVSVYRDSNGTRYVVRQTGIATVNHDNNGRYDGEAVKFWHSVSYR